MCRLSYNHISTTKLAGTTVRWLFTGFLNDVIGLDCCLPIRFIYPQTSIEFFVLLMKMKTIPKLLHSTDMQFTHTKLS